MSLGELTNIVKSLKYHWNFNQLIGLVLVDGKTLVWGFDIQEDTFSSQKSSVSQPRYMFSIIQRIPGK